MDTRNHVLVVEDDADIADLVVHAASQLGYHVTTADTVNGAKRRTSEQMPDIVILDRMLADGSEGLDYLAWLNALEGPRPGILVTSRLTSVSDHVAGLEAGADDYIDKPFHPEELRARLRAVARRASSSRVPNSVLFFDTLELRQLSATALVGDTKLDLRPQSFANLPPQDTVINTAISRLRRVLSSVDGAPGLLSEDLGYRLVPGSQA